MNIPPILDDEDTSEGEGCTIRNCSRGATWPFWSASSNAANSLRPSCVSQQLNRFVTLEITQRTGEQINELQRSANKEDCASSEPVRGRSRARMCIRHSH